AIPDWATSLSVAVNERVRDGYADRGAMADQVRLESERTAGGIHASAMIPDTQRQENSARIKEYLRRVPSASEFGVKAIAFDFGNIFHTFDYRNTAAEIHRRYGVDEEAAVLHFEQRESDRSHWMYLHDKGIINKTQAKELFLSWVRGKSSKTGIELTDDEFDSLMWTTWNKDVEEMYTMAKVAREKGYVVKVITTTNSTHYGFVVRKLEGLLANGTNDIYASDIMRFDKRQPDIYIRVAEDAGLRPGQVLFIDDVEENIGAAAEAGLQTVLFKPGEIGGSVDRIIEILAQNFDSFLRGMGIREVREHMNALVEYMYGAYGVEAGDVLRMLDIIGGSRTSDEAVQKVYAAGFEWNNAENKYGKKYRAYKTGTSPDIRSEAVRQFVRGPVVFDIATGNTSFFNKVIGPIRDRVTSARGSDIVVNKEQLSEIQIKAASNGIEFLPQSLDDQGKLPAGIEDHSVDTVTIIGALHHMTDEVRDSILGEALRILRPDGRLVVLEDTSSAVDPMTFTEGTYKEDVRRRLLDDFNRLSAENQKYVFALVDWMGNHLAPGDTSIPLSFNFKTREEWREIFRKAGFEVGAEANLGVTPYKFHTHPELIFSLNPIPAAGRSSSGNAEENAMFTRDVRDLNNDLRQGVLNIFVMRAKTETIGSQTEVGQETGRKIRETVGLNTQMLYFEDGKELTAKLEKAVATAMSFKNKGKYPKIFVDCLTPEDLAQVKQFIAAEELAGNNGLNNIIATGKDFADNADVRDIPDEVKVILVGSVLMNDRRLREDFKMSARELMDSRRKIIDFLKKNDIIENKVVADQDIDSFFEELWTGIRRLTVTRINWKEFQDFKNGQDAILESL
ncbi:MAG: HAD-IA family hydrolase, partial [Candidatus Omnitrophica bacterium]|nr:HAD-IA family hydrolase [Candidatus Omnitrophota bacterium]